MAPLFEAGVHIDFAHRAFRWGIDAALKARVHCVIVGFSASPNDKPKAIYSEACATAASNINGCVLDAPNVFAESRTKPLCGVPEIGIGNKPIDGGNYPFIKEEMEEFAKKEPASAKWFRSWYGPQEFINRVPAIAFGSGVARRMSCARCSNA